MSAVNDQVTDAVTQINALLTGGAAAQSMAMLDIAGAETMGMSMFNAVTAQQNAQTSTSAAVTASCAKMLKTDLPAKPAPAKKDDAKSPAELVASAQASIQLAEQKLAVTIAADALYQLYKKQNPNAHPDKEKTAIPAITAAISEVKTELTKKSGGGEVSEKLIDNATALLSKDVENPMAALKKITN